MKKYLLLISLCGCCFPAAAQQKAPKWAEKAKKAVISLEIQDRNGTLRKGNGFFVQENGEAVSDYTLFAGAEKAFATDADGRRFPVTQILGADEMYDVIRFRVDVPKRVTALVPATEQPVQGTVACLLSRDLEKDAALPGGTVVEVSRVKEAYGYFKIDAPLTSSQVSLPLLTPEGEVFAMAQEDASGQHQTYGISVPYILSLRIAPTDLFSKTYAAMDIRKAWAATPEDAQIALLFYASQQDAPAYLETLNDFIASFPNVSAGYQQRASHYAYHRKDLAATEAEQERLLSLAQADMETGAKYMETKGEYFYEQAKLIYGVASGDSALQLPAWSMEAAWANVRKAIAENDEPAYRQLEGDMAFYRGDYGQAYESYLMVSRSPLASGFSFYMAARARQQMPDANLAEVIALMDSAIGKSASLPDDALVYLQENAGLKMQLGMYDAAAADYDRCYTLAAGNVSDAFYYLREQARFRAGNLDGALKDISSAIILDPQNAIYYAEEASIYLRRQLPDKAQESLLKAISLDPDFASSHRLLGVSYLRQEKKDEACKAFQKARELGDPVVDKLIRENCQ
ncbi:MAG: serine protease [Tannerella sp.]|jgi:cytochrome c-type biogenesis protein CcmH/NrfG|nr:serine protease [Tannerella sp.]